MNELETWLHKYINNTSITPDGEVYFIKRQVDKIRNMKIEIYASDHNPPHFHVESNCKTIDAVFNLTDGSFMKGEISGKDKKIIEAFYVEKRELLMSVWNKMN